jgi:phosphatidylglycerophosphatase A
MRKIGVALGTFFGVGFMPVAPGTWASLLTVLIAYFTPLSRLPLLHLSLITVAIYAVGIPAAAACEKHFQKKDPRPCVIDEVAGQMVCLWMLPRQPALYIAAFLLFRLFDIWKPFPVNKSESLPHGFGIMTDDILAGAYSMVVLLVARRFIFR